MKVKTFTSNIIIVISISLLLTMLVSCTEHEPTTPISVSTEPAKFVVTNLDIYPQVVLTDHLVTVTATIENIGETKGIYTAILIVAEQEIERRNALVEPKATQTITFKITGLEVAGNYKLSVGEVSKTLSVFEQQPRLEQYLLSHDDGLPEASYWTGEESHLIHFSPPTKIFTIERVMIYGWVATESPADYEKRKFTVKVWDKKASKELWRQNFSWRLFESKAKWIELDITNVTVNDDFYVEVTTYSSRETRICIDYDSSTLNEHSYMSRNGKIIPWIPWTREEVEYTREKVNWMIRVGGRAPAE